MGDDAAVEWSIGKAVKTAWTTLVRAFTWLKPGAHGKAGADRIESAASCKKSGDFSESCGGLAQKYFSVKKLRIEKGDATEVFDFSPVATIFHDISRYFTLFFMRKTLILRGLEKTGGGRRCKQLKIQSSKFKIEGKWRHELHDLTRMVFSRSSEFGTPVGTGSRLDREHGSGRNVAMKFTCLLVVALVGFVPVAAFSQTQSNRPPVRIAIAGLEHDHAMGFIPRFTGRTDVELAGIVETNRDLIARYSQRFNLDSNLFYPSLAALFAATNVDAVATFTSTFAHQRVVEACAAQGVDVMMEKPLATTVKQARAIEAAVKKSGIGLVVNYETTWYPATQAAYTLVHDEKQIGELRKLVFHDGHRGPKEIGCSTNFLAWLTDPVLNGGGAINDFGCYGADMATWFMGGQRPVSVFCAAQHLKPQIYPKVEDDATIIVNYPGAQVILQPSWNWPFDRKDMEVYGQTGTVFVPKPTLMRVRTGSMVSESEATVPAVRGAEGDSLSYLAAVARKQLKPEGLSSLEVNVIVVEILEAAHKSAATGKEIKF